MASYRLIALTVSSAIFIQFLDTTILNTAIPSIARDLGVQAVDLDVTILSYQISIVLFIPVASTIAGRVGVRNAFALSLAIFMVGSTLCGIAPSLPALIASRIIQGAGAGLMLPLGRLLLVRSVDKRNLISAMNWMSIPGALGPLLGPALGGFIATYGSWRWIFFINVPIAILGVGLAFACVPDIRDEKQDRLDTIGLLLLAPALFCIAFGLRGPSEMRDGWFTLAFWAGGLVLALLYIRHSRAAAVPVLNLSLFSIPSLRYALMSGMVVRIVMGATGFILPLWFQLAMHMSAAQAGARVMMLSAGTLLTRLLGPTVLRYGHPRDVAIFGVASLSITLLVTSCLQPSWPLICFYLIITTLGLMISLPGMIITPVTYVDVVPERMGAATGLELTLQQLSYSIGVTIAVWSITSANKIRGMTLHDNSTYVGSLILLSGFTLFGLYSTWKFDPEKTGELRPRRQ